MLRSEMLFRMEADSSISTMKVDSPCEMLSEAPTRVKILSTMPMRASAAGTNEPICAISTIRAVCRSRADLPDMLGPVIMMICCSLSSSTTSLGTYSSPTGISISITGWRPCRISIRLPSFSSGRV